MVQHTMTERKAACRLAGFTIVELMVVVVLIVLLAGAGGGVVTLRTFKKIQADSAVRHLMFAAKHAKLTAIERQSPCILALDTEENAFGLFINVVDEQTGMTQQMPLNDFYFKKAVDLPGDVEFEDIRITSLDGTEPDYNEQVRQVVFLPDGTAQRSVIQIGDGNTHFAVSISAATGKAKVYVGTGEDIPPDTVDLEQQL
jgi:Tfp pilus assembly protein FimT